MTEKLSQERNAVVEQEWRKLYMRAFNAACGYANLVDDRPGVLRMEKELAQIEADARALAQPQGVAPAEPVKLICPKCGADRYKEQCRDGYDRILECPMVGTAASAPAEKPKEEHG
jgi:hypothetical protein